MRCNVSNHDAACSVSTGGHRHQLVRGPVRLSGRQSLGNGQPSGEAAFKNIIWSLCATSRFHGRQCPSEIIRYRKTSEKKATGSLPRRHSVASAHVSPLRRATVQRAEESRLRSSARYALHASAWKWDYSERERGRNRLLVQDADKEPPHCGTFFSCV